ncbi:MAG: hypothetical protein KF773_24240 [Deltaproteobacteria bacterium]|nr:hypothetical protein [Deltaproteobacteria bacterium]
MIVLALYTLALLALGFVVGRVTAHAARTRPIRVVAPQLPRMLHRRPLEANRRRQEIPRIDGGAS